jgi:hypothetical protein
MKQLFTFNLKLLTLMFLAYQGLKALFDPAMEGNPYIREEEEKSYSLSITQRLLKNLN